MTVPTHPSSKNRKSKLTSSHFQKKKKREKKPSFKKEKHQQLRSAPSKPNEFFELENKLLWLLKKEALTIEALTKNSSITTHEKPVVSKALQQLEQARLIVRIRKDHYVVPKSADLVVGTLQVHASGGAHVLPEQGESPDLYVGAENTGTGMHGDLVMARLIKDRRARLSGRERRAEGEVVRVLERANKTVVGTLQYSQSFYYVIADNPRFIHNLYLSGDLLGAKPGEKVVASLDRWESRHNNPEGKILEVLGAADAPGVDMLSIIRKHQLPVEFPHEVLSEAAKYESTITRDDLEGREDLRDRVIITIDPDDARDFDDAIEVQRTETGWEVSIHIADVAHYVQPHSALDKEAYQRGNSVYLVDRVIPMLPENLSNGLCSLRPNEDRLAFSVFASIHRTGTVKHVRFARTVIRSKARLTYKEALVLLEQPPKDEIGHRVHTAWECSSLLRRCRFKNGALDLEMPEVKVWLDATGKAIKLELIKNDISHQLIEELMLLANELVARHLKNAQQPLLYRVHEKPDPEKLNEYRELAATYGVRAGDLNGRKELQKLLDGLKGASYEHALKIGLLKSLKRARYCPEPLGHYGLQKKDYSHFTSPIRRYADLITHRSLAKQIGSTPKGPSSKDLYSIGEHISTTERTAGDAEKESVRLKKLDYFEAQQKSQHGHQWMAHIVEARNYGLLVELPDVLVSGLVPVSSMDDDFYFFDALHSRLVGRQTQKTYRAGEKIAVVIDKVDRWKQQIDFRIAGSKKVGSKKTTRHKKSY